MSAASSSSSSAPVSALPRIAASSAASSNTPSASVSVEDESTKRCSACSEDRPASAYSSAQLKKKGKRVCSHCVNKKDAAAAAQHQAASTAAAAARKDAMKSAFAAKLNSTPTQAASECHCCVSAAAVRFTPCIRCSVDCCSLRCFDQHDCDVYLEAKRTMPTELIPQEDRFRGEEDIASSWQELLDHARAIPASVSAAAVERCAYAVRQLGVAEKSVSPLVSLISAVVRDFYSPRVSRPWWNPALCARLHWDPHMPDVVGWLMSWLAPTARWPCSIIEESANAPMGGQDRHSKAAWIHGQCIPDPRIDIRSVCFLPGRLCHRVLTLFRFVLRAMGSEWVRAHFALPGDVSNDAFGIFPALIAKDGALQDQLGYVEVPAPDTGLRTLVPLAENSTTSSGIHFLRQHLGHRMLTMVLRDGQMLLDRGLHLIAFEDNTVLWAVSGWTGKAMDSFTAAPTRCMYVTDEYLLRTACDPNYAAAIRDELEARKRPDYFHLIPAIKRMIPEDEWPTPDGGELFIPTPQRGIESELVELELLESLAEEAAAGNKQARLLIAHIEDECNRIGSQDALDGSTESFSSSASAAAGESAAPNSRTASKAYASLADVCTAGLAKYKTITSAALRFLRFAPESAQSSSPGANVSKHAPLTIADILAAKRARMQRMIDEQLLIHAEAVERAENRRRIDAGRVISDASVSPASALAGSSSSALAPTSAASSTSSSRSNSVGVGPASAGLSSAGSSSLVSAFAAAHTDGSPYSWTSSFKTLESMRGPGRVKYKTITSAALRFLHTLRPVSVNRSGGSHTVFHFASGKPVTLVTPHGGDGTVSRHAATRLYAVMHEAALQQLSSKVSIPASSSVRQSALTAASF